MEERGAVGDGEAFYSRDSELGATRGGGRPSKGASDSE